MKDKKTKPLNDEALTLKIMNHLKLAGLRATRQRIELGRLLFSGEDRHMTAENLYVEAKSAGMSISLATIYNTLHQFTQAGMLRQVVVDPSRSYFDTNITDHHHFFFADEGELIDIPHDKIQLSSLPRLPKGLELEGVDVVVRVTREK
jgi:Fur family iron response transcriptional regulator